MEVTHAAGGPLAACTFLGIDLGTSAVKACIADGDGKTLKLASKSLHKKSLGLQHPDEVFTAMLDCFQQLKADALRGLTCIVVTGQMHGVLGWKRGVDGRPTACTQLYTWEFNESAEFLNERCKTLNIPARALRPGFGVGTIAWLRAQGKANGSTHFSTIQDYIIAHIADEAQHLIDYTNASSWGCFNEEILDWRREWINALNIPVESLPRATTVFTSQGRTTQEFMKEAGLSQPCSVVVGCGDHPCTLVAPSVAPQLYVNIGTSSQVSLPFTAGDVEMKSDADGHGFEIRPHVLRGERIVVGAAMNGGNVFEAIATSFASFLESVGHPAKLPDVWEMLDTGASKLAADSPGEVACSALPFTERFTALPELAHGRNRVGTSLPLSASGNPAAQLLAAVRGVIYTLFHMLPWGKAKQLQVSRVVVGGGAVGRLSVLRRELEREVRSRLPDATISFDEAISSAHGAAILAAKCMKEVSSTAPPEGEGAQGNGGSTG